MEKILFKNEILNTVLGVLLVIFAIVAYFTGWITDFFGIIIGVVIILVSIKRFLETFKVVKKKEATAILVIEIIADLVCGFVLITSKQSIGLFVGIVFYIRGFAYLLINYLATRRGNLFQYFLNIGFLTLGSYLIFGGNTYLNVIEIIILVLLGIVGIIFATFGIRVIVEKQKKKPKSKKEPKVKKEPVQNEVKVEETVTKQEEPVIQKKVSMTESVQKSLPQTAPLNKEEKTEVDYEQMTVTELKDLCKERGLSNYTSLRKSELIDLLK